MADFIAYGHAWMQSHPNLPLRLFVLADAGQDKNTWKRLSQVNGKGLSLLNTQDSEVDAFSPHLLDLGLLTAPNAAWDAAVSASHPTAAFTLLCCPLPAVELQRHLMRFLDVRLSGDVEMLLAFWDPAILGTLIGQKDDDSLHVSGPVLTPEQRQAFLSPIVSWWYCDREARWHSIEMPPDRANGFTMERLVLTQDQEDMLVEASVPDQVLHHIELNQPHLFETTHPHAVRYSFVKAVLGPARKLGLIGMRDLVNFTALCLIYRRRMQTDPQISHLLDQVQKKAMTLDEAMPLMPE